jgi:hypothetical protein
MTNAELRAVIARRVYDANTRAYWHLGRAFARQAIELRSWLSAWWALRYAATWAWRRVT